MPAVGLWLKLACVLLVLAIAIAGAIVVRAGIDAAGGALFSRNDRFAIRRLDVTAGRLITSELVQEYMQISEGMNLFAFDVKRARLDFLRRCPGVKSMEISRVLPDTLRIVIVERQPVARLAGRRFVVDAEGIAFRVPVDTSRLPMITGHAGQQLKAGDRVAAGVDRALQVLELCEDPACGIQLDSLRVDRLDYLILYPGAGHSVRRIHLSWKGMAKRDELSEANLGERLKWVAKALNSAKSKGLTFLDATYEGRMYGE